ncbi:kinetochore protein NDC80 homolog [Tribolium madens]|uniref:kinetochore protein NDC80 homolog n=1 Tax=Tribolium madens TaxID=41895 RepID=UPI001CF74BDA|nr:kinetochore protein NDC80 homolog [Tribolium madens]
MFRRTSSSSNIPVVKGDYRARSKSVVRVSTKDDGNKKARASSMDRTLNPLTKRSMSSSNLKRPSVTPSVSYKRSTTGLTPTLGSGFKRSNSNLTTPRSRSKSPFKIGSERSVNDKKWVSEQFAKVRAFLQEHPKCPEHIPNNLKPTTINSFVTAFNLLFKEIDPRFEINTTNYKDIVLNTLKIYQFPGTISLSLLKTVNTMHAWPQVISIFAWLVDLITYINQTSTFVSPDLEQDLKYQKIECITNYIFERYQLYNKDEDEKIADRAVGQQLSKILNIDEEEHKRVQEEVAKLSQLKEQRLGQIEEQKHKNEMLEKEIARLREETESFYRDKEQREEMIHDSINLLKERKEKLVALIKAKRENVESLKKKINTQPCTIREKKRILEHIEEMKHTIDLKKEKLKTQKAIETEYHSQLKEAKTKVINEVYRLNHSLMKLTVIEPKLKVLSLNENSDFLSNEFQEDVENLPEKIKSLENTINDEIKSKKTAISEMKSQIASVEAQIVSDKQKLQGLIEKEASLKDQIQLLEQHFEKIEKQRSEEKTLFEQKMRRFDEDAPPLDELKRDVDELKKIKKEKEETLEKHKYEALVFFAKVEEEVSSYVEKMNNVRTKVLDKLTGSLEQTIKVQQEIIDDMLKLEEIRETEE